MTLLHVQESRLFKLRPALSKSIGASILNSAAKRLKGLKFDQKTESGDPAKVIIQMADKGNYDVIVMGGRGRNSIGRPLLGDVANHVIHYTNRSVIIVK
jgi:nucleotide-binding universal stress UspA family protein